MRKLRTAADLFAAGWSVGRVRRELRDRTITHIVKGVYGEGGEAPSELDVMRATALVLVPPTESLLETLAVQLIRRDARIPAPTRQFSIYDDNGNFVGRPDLCWPELGIFVELDGQVHKDQPVYDASRQTRIVIATGWRPGRFTWDQVHDFPEATLRDIAALVLPITVS